jgi:hypothetical protein
VPSPPANPLANALSVEATPDGYAVAVDPRWSIGDRPNGGYLMALVARAGVAASPHPDLLAVSAHFLRPPSFGPATVVVDEMRVGRSVGFHHARLVEAGEVVVDARVMSGRLQSGDPDWVTDPAPWLPPPEECPRARTTAPDGTQISLYDAVEVRYDRETVRWAGRDATPQPPVVRAWVRVGDETDAYAVTVAADALPPAVFALGARGWAPTVEMTTYVRAQPAPGWLRVEVRTELVAGGWFDEQARVWDEAGRLVGQARQLAMVGRTPS